MGTVTAQHQYQELTTKIRPIFILRGASTQAGEFFAKLSFIVEQRKTTGLDLPLGQKEGEGKNSRAGLVNISREGGTK